MLCFALCPPLCPRAATSSSSSSAQVARGAILSAGLKANILGTGQICAVADSRGVSLVHALVHVHCCKESDKRTIVWLGVHAIVDDAVATMGRREGACNITRKLE